MLVTFNGDRFIIRICNAGYIYISPAKVTPNSRSDTNGVSDTPTEKPGISRSLPFVLINCQREVSRLVVARNGAVDFRVKSFRFRNKLCSQ